MSLYYETATILENPDKIGGSFKARIFKKKDLKSKPGQIYALVAEASKWSKVLKDVIEKCAVLKEERKVRLESNNLGSELRSHATQLPCSTCRIEPHTDPFSSRPSSRSSSPTTSSCQNPASQRTKTTFFASRLNATKRVSAPSSQKHVSATSFPRSTPSVSRSTAAISKPTMAMKERRSGTRGGFA
jgi:hypothetical protein